MGKLYQHIINNFPTDIEINLVDSHSFVKINSHKCVLGCYFEYFKKMFNFPKEKNQSLIKIEVPNAKVAGDIITLLNKIDIAQQSAQYILDLFRCRRFFCLENDPKLLYKIKIEAKHFQLFMDRPRQGDSLPVCRFTPFGSGSN